MCFNIHKLVCFISRLRDVFVVSTYFVFLHKRHRNQSTVTTKPKPPRGDYHLFGSAPNPFKIMLHSLTGPNTLEARVSSPVWEWGHKLLMRKECRCSEPVVLFKSCHRELQQSRTGTEDNFFPLRRFLNFSVLERRSSNSYLVVQVSTVALQSDDPRCHISTLNYWSGHRG